MTSHKILILKICNNFIKILSNRIIILKCIIGIGMKGAVTLRLNCHPVHGWDQATRARSLTDPSPDPSHIPNSYRVALLLNKLRMIIIFKSVQTVKLNPNQTTVL